jgi:hypothetical protein
VIAHSASAGKRLAENGRGTARRFRYFSLNHDPERRCAICLAN